MNVSPTVQCGDCGATLDEPTNLHAALRRPCAVPGCGSKSRHIAVQAHDALDVRDSWGVKLWRGLTGKLAQEHYTGISQSADGTFAEVQMLRDYETHLDMKRVVLADGTVVRDVSGDLREHTGRGSDRPGRREARQADRRQKAAARAARKREIDEEWRRRNPTG